MRESPVEIYIIYAYGQCPSVRTGHEVLCKALSHFPLNSTIYLQHIHQQCKLLPID